MIYLTEEDARKKWCPFTRLSDRCCASQCMSWRWKQLSAIDRQTIREWARTTSHADAESRFRKRAGGYCGLAGKPGQ